MKMKFSVKLIIGFVLASVIFGATGCKKMFDLKPEDAVDASEAYQTLEDADAAMIGLYGKLQGLAEKYVVLNELRADLADVTLNSNAYLRQISENNISSDNPYADPRPYYDVILNCNDVLTNFNLMYKNHKISAENYTIRRADVIALRAWVYLQLGIQYGKVPYISIAPKTINDLKSDALYPKVPFGTLVDTLILQMEGLGRTTLATSATYPAAASNYVIDGSYNPRTWINKFYLLGELYLWRNRYVDAASAFKEVMETETNNTNANLKYNTYRIAWGDGTNYDLTIRYTRSQDPSTLVAGGLGWSAMFYLTNSYALWQTEWVWAIPYNYTFAPDYPFINLFANRGAGKYLIKPSQNAINNWNSQTQLNGIPYDSRSRLTYTTTTGQPEIIKYSYLYDTSLPLQKSGYWYLWRAAGLHLHYSEAANRAGQGKVAWALLNNGILGTYAPGVTNTPTIEDLDKERTGLPYPFNFDARNSGSVSTTYRDPWYKNTGIRNRANLLSLSTSYQTDMLGLEDKLLDEGALELAYEGYRWSDLLRISLRREELQAGSGKSYLGGKIAAKFTAAGKPVPAGVAKLSSDIDSWYLPFKWND